MTKLEARFLRPDVSEEVLMRFRAFMALPFKAGDLAYWLNRKPRGVNWTGSSKSGMAKHYATGETFGRPSRKPVIDEELFQELDRLGRTNGSLRAT